MNLSGEQHKKMEEALISAFPTKAALKRMVRYKLDINLDQITGNGGLSSIVFELINWVDAQGRIDELVDGGYAENPGNPLLAAFYEAYHIDNKPRPQSGKSSTSLANKSTIIHASTYIKGDVNITNGDFVGRDKIPSTSDHPQAPSSSSQLSRVKRENLQQQLTALLQDYEAASAQLSSTLSELDRRRIRRSLETLENEIAQVEAELAQLE
jgi:hypothetical protein